MANPSHYSEEELDVKVDHKEQRRKRAELKALQFNVLTIVTIMMLIAVFLAVGKRPTQSFEENRDLAKCPKFTFESYLDGTFTAEFSEFYNDAVPMRSTFKGIISDFRGHLGIPYEGAELIGNVPTTQKDPTPAATEPATKPAPTENAPAGDPDATGAQEETLAETEPETTEPVENPYEEEDNGEIANNILIVKDRGIMLFGGSMSAAENYASIVNDYKTALGSDVNVYSMVAPTAVSFYLPKKFKDASNSEAENIDHINSCLNGVTPIDVIAKLDPHKQEAIYSRTDHHWQPLGAFYAAEEFASVAGVPFAPLDKYETVVKEGYVGTLYGYTGSQTLKDNPEPFIYYKPTNNITTTYYNPDMTNEREAPLMLNIDNLEASSWYLVFMGGDERITHVETDCKNGRTLFIIKDSYGNALVPCLTSSFEDIWVVDMRFFEQNIISFMKERDVTDVLFAMNTYSANSGNADKCRTIMNQ
ncbi:MAG: hypothetical protein J5851_09985 [Oscillospiraceae bacterium]|nr:hypothetical protein [Oscillospiraceae bacterium]